MQVIFAQRNSFNCNSSISLSCEPFTVEVMAARYDISISMNTCFCMIPRI